MHAEFRFAEHFSPRGSAYLASYVKLSCRATLADGQQFGADTWVEKTQACDLHVREVIYARLRTACEKRIAVYLQEQGD